jgi:hypothetical protein
MRSKARESSVLAGIRAMISGKREQADPTTVANVTDDRFDFK